MTGKRVSVEQVKVIDVFRAEPRSWFGSDDVGRRTGLPTSSIRHFLHTFHKLGLIERVEVYPGYRYRLSSKAEAQPYFEKLCEASAVMRN